MYSSETGCWCLGLEEAGSADEECPEAEGALTEVIFHAMGLIGPMTMGAGAGDSLPGSVPQKAEININSAIFFILFINGFPLLVDDLPCVAVDRDKDPVALFAFHDKLVSRERGGAGG